MIFVRILTKRFEAGIGMEQPMHIKDKRDAVAVRFGTEKAVGFPMLMGIFDSVVTRDSNTRRSSGWGASAHHC